MTQPFHVKLVQLDITFQVDNVWKFRNQLMGVLFIHPMMDPNVNNAKKIIFFQLINPLVLVKLNLKLV